MKTSVLFILSFVALISAQPFNGLDMMGKGRRYGMGYDNMRPGSGIDFDNERRYPSEMVPGAGIVFDDGMGPAIGMPGTGMGFENGMPATGMAFENEMRPEYGLGGMNRGGPRGYGFGQFENGKEFAGRHFSNGASGMQGQAFKNSGGKHYHNIGSHHHHAKTIKEEENDESHNIGGSEGFDNSAKSGGAFRNYQNGGEAFGKEFGQGSEGVSF
ncbi:unnamed protein product [Leptosia nina]|uniref:Uncharacterized protein n=1 Tax=Leptosia nina TaxID=320188 RepID=A0AAV1J033_9NEOP